MASLNTGTSIVDFLKSSGKDSSFSSRANLAVQQGIVSNVNQYTGSASQNTSLLNKLKGGGVKPSPTISTVKDKSEANEFINANQDRDFSVGSQADEPKTRKSFSDTKDLFDQINRTLTQGLDKPDVPNFSDRFNELRSESGVGALETELARLEKIKRDTEAQLRIRTSAEEGKRVALNVIEGRVTETERQENERINQLNSEITFVSDQIDSKNAVIETIMGFEQLDFENATKAYETEFKNRVSVFDRALDVADFENDLAKERASTARANGEIFVNTLVKSGKSASELDSSSSAQLQKWGLEAGLGRNFFFDLIEATEAEGEKKKILTHVTSKDKSSVTVVYEDGTTSSVATGISDGGSGSGSGSGEKLSPLDLKRIEELYGFTPPLGVTMDQVEQFIQDNPDATPRELQDGINFFFKGGDEGSSDDGGGSSAQFLDKDYFKDNYTTKQLKSFSDKAGTSSFFTGKTKDVDRFLDLLTGRIQTARGQGLTDQEILDFINSEFLTS